MSACQSFTKNVMVFAKNVTLIVRPCPGALRSDSTPSPPPTQLMQFTPPCCIIIVNPLKEEVFMALFQDQKGKNIINYQKMINEKKDTIRKYYDEIGHLYYGQYKDMNIDVTKDINARCESISNIYKDIEELNIKILREKGLKKCAICSTENQLANAFCFKCGARFADDDAIPADVIAPPNACATPPSEKPAVPAEPAPEAPAAVEPAAVEPEVKSEEDI